MPDDPDALARLADAARAVARVFGSFRGEEGWGDAMPHHPHQRPEMTVSQVEQLHRRPAEVPCTDLDWAEVDYFFSHAGYTTTPEETLPAAIRYFLPRLAEVTLTPSPPTQLNMLLIGSHLGKVKWRTWKPPQAQAIHAWLRAWLDAALRYRTDTWPSGYEGIYEPDGNRDPIDTVGSVTEAGLARHEVLELLGDLDEAAMVRVLVHAFPGPRDDPWPDARSVLKQWAAGERIRQRLFDAALSDVPWAPAADRLYAMAL